jgi:outer membrane protein
MIGKISLGLNVLLIVAVAYLFSQMPGEESSDMSQSNDQPAVKVDGSAVSINYILEDSLMAWYDYALIEGEKFQNEQQASQLTLAGLQRELEEQAYLWQNYVMENPGSEEEARKDLMDREDKIARLQRKMEAKYIEFNTQLIDKVTTEVETYAKNQGIDFVLNTSSQAPIFWHSSESRNITRQIADELNIAYNASLIE